MLACFVLFGTYTITDKLEVFHTPSSGNPDSGLLRDTGFISTGTRGYPNVGYPSGYYFETFDYCASDLSFCVTADKSGTAWWLEILDANKKINELVNNLKKDLDDLDKRFNKKNRDIGKLAIEKTKWG